MYASKEKELLTLEDHGWLFPLWGLVVHWLIIDMLCIQH